MAPYGPGPMAIRMVASVLPQKFEIEKASAHVSDEELLAITRGIENSYGRRDDERSINISQIHDCTLDRARC